MFLDNFLGPIYFDGENKVCPYLLLSQLVSVNSQVGNIEGIELVQNLIQKILTDLGFDVSFIKNSLCTSAPLLLAKKRGRKGGKTVSFIGHSDVITNPIVNPFRIEGNRIYGSGVADDKGGVVTCLMALTEFLENNNNQNLNINVIISPNEETGSIGFHELFKDMGLESDFVFGLEPALKCGSLISSRGGNRWYYLKFKGISAHSGRFGHNHINAAHLLSLFISKIHGLNDEEKKRRVNVGSFSGGEKGFNTICGDAWARLDVRFSSFECRDTLHAEIENAIEETFLSCPYSGQNSFINYSIEDDCPPLNNNENYPETLNFLKNEISELEQVSVVGKHAGGAADINYFSTPENVTIDGLGPIGENLHTNQECIKKDSLLTRIKAISNLLTLLNES